MALITRHSGAPYANGEVLAAADLEHDMDTAYDEINGQLENANVDAAAGINGAKILPGSVGSGLLAALAVTTAKFADRSIDGTRIASATITQGDIAVDSVFRLGTPIADTSPTVLPATDYQTLYTRTVTTSAVPGSVLLMFFWSTSGVLLVSDYVRIIRNGDVVMPEILRYYPVTVGQAAGGDLIATWVDESPPASGTLVYEFQIRHNVVGGTALTATGRGAVALVLTR